MKYLILSLAFTLSFQSLADITPTNSWYIVHKVKDKTIQQGFSKIKIIVKDSINDVFINNVSIHLNSDSLLGSTNVFGELNARFNSGKNKLCFDTKEGSSFAFNYEFKNQYSYVIKILIENKNRLTAPRPHVLKKPVIYLYPTTKQKINVKVTPKGEFVFTYPAYPKNGWSIIADPNGEILYNNRNYNYLFWEGNSYTLDEIDKSKGFIVNSDTIVSFLENTLSTIGLSDIEQADFITFWAPQLQQNKLNFIHFEFNVGYEKYISTIAITPSPDTEIRVFMVFKAVTKNEQVIAQKIPSYKRKGFTVVEWGGSYLNE